MGRGQRRPQRARRNACANGQIDVGQSYITELLFTPPGQYSTTQTPTEGIQFIAQSPTEPPNPRYNKFGHQVIGLYVGPNSTGGYQFGLGIHNTLSDENPDKWLVLSWKFTGTLVRPMRVHWDFKQEAAGAWKLELSTPGQSALVLTSSEYGTLWNTTYGIDGVQIFTSQGNSASTPAFEWTKMEVR
jgi:hypothetical protein